jgi:hypothetical protein
MPKCIVRGPNNNNTNNNNNKNNDFRPEAWYGQASSITIFRDRDNPKRCRATISATGATHFRTVSDRNKEVRAVMVPNDDGIVPVSALPLTCKLSRTVKAPSDDGILPFN